jgi:hypothetical protein
MHDIVHLFPNEDFYIIINFPIDLKFLRSNTTVAWAVLVRSGGVIHALHQPPKGKFSQTKENPVAEESVKNANPSIMPTLLLLSSVAAPVAFIICALLSARGWQYKDDRLHV